MSDRLIYHTEDSARAWVGAQAPSREEGRALSGPWTGQEFSANEVAR